MKKKIFSIMMAFMLVLTMFGGVFASADVSGEDGEGGGGPATSWGQVNVTLHKVHNLPPATRGYNQNTGEEMPDFGGEALPGVEFTLFDVTDEYYELIKGSDQTEAIANLQEAYYKEIPADAIKISAVTTDEDGLAVFNNLDIKDEETDRFKVYIFVETKTPLDITVLYKATPLVLAMPIYKMNGEEFTDVINRDIHLYPKNETAKDEKVFENPEDFTVVDINGKEYFNITTGDILDFSVYLNIPFDIAEVEQLSLTDTPTPGLAYAKDAEGKDSTVIEGFENGVDYTITEDGAGGFTIDFKVGSDALLDRAGSLIVIKYKMQLTAEVTPDTIHGNSAQVSIDNVLQDKIITTTDPEEFPEIPEFFTGGHKFIKLDAQSGSPLFDARFIISNLEGQYAKLTTNSKGEYVFVEWVGVDEATEIRSASDGTFSVIGLLHGNYKLTETKAPTDEYVKIDVELDFTVKEGYTTSELQKILNHRKGLLPSTGGNGIYAYLAVGTLMMLGAVIWYKRSSKKVVANH